MKFRLEEIEVPEDEPFKYDALKRQPVVEFVRNLIKQLEGPFVLALDSPWGTGKTTVVRMLRASLKSEGFASVYFNAWKEDYVSDPLIPMVGWCWRRPMQQQPHQTRCWPERSKG